MLARRLSSPARVLPLAGALALLVGGVTAGGASAAIPWAACSTAGYQCATLDVPVDRTGAVPGTISLGLKRVPAATNPNNVAVVPLAGGPGQSALPLTETFAQVLKSAIATRDLVVFDQRGTGSSGQLQCNSLSSDASIDKVAGSCAAQLGAGRGFYRTPDSVADIEALRVAGGYSKLVLFGVSYGTKVAEQYAAAYPQNVEALVLDSVVTPDGPDPFSRSTLQAMPRVLRELCSGGACKGATDSVTRDLTKLAARLRKSPLKTRVVLSTARRVSITLKQDDLVQIITAGDLNPTLRAELPGSMHAALQGDGAPLARLAVRSEGLTTGLQGSAGSTGSATSALTHQSDDDGISEALYLATTCEESPFAWTRAASVKQRQQEIIAAANAIPKAQLGPFSPTAALTASGSIPLCLGWPDASAAPAPTAALPAVRTLILDGQMDVRTPIEDARAVSGTIPGSSVVEVPFTGHSTSTSDMTKDSSCTQGALATFFSGGTPAACAPGTNPLGPTIKPPRSIRAVHARSQSKRTIVVAAATLDDASRQILGDELALDSLPHHVAGLRAGNATVSGNGAFTLNRYQYVPGVVVSGKVSTKGIANITIHGGGALSGTLRLSPGGTVSGRLNGRKVTIGASSALRSKLPTPAEALASLKPALG
jgi:pimeloyl-ACP methyl ester carboxylesterase